MPSKTARRKKRQALVHRREKEAMKYQHALFEQERRDTLRSTQQNQRNPENNDVLSSESMRDVENTQIKTSKDTSRSYYQELAEKEKARRTLKDKRRRYWTIAVTSLAAVSMIAPMVVNAILATVHHI